MSNALEELSEKTKFLLWYKDPAKFFKDIYGLEPYPYQAKVLRELADTKVHRVLVCASGGCIVEGEKVLMGDGTYKNIENIVVGDMVVSNSNGKCVVKRVIGTQFSGMKQSYLLKLGNGATLKCSYNHPILNDKNEWKQAETFTSYNNRHPKYKAMSQATFDVPDYPITDGKITLLAWLLAEGHYGIDQTPKITNTSYLQLSRLSNILKNEFGFSGNLRYKTKSPKQIKDIFGMDLLLTNGDKNHSSKIIEWLNELGIYGQTKDKKQLPSIVYKFSNKQLQLFLKEFWYGDGTLDQECRLIWYAGLSESIASSIVLLLNRLNRYPTIYKDGNSYEVRLYYNDVDKLSNNITTTEWCHIIEDLGIKPVYDIQVEDTHNFIINSFVLHNSGKTKLIACHALWLSTVLSKTLDRPVTIVVISGSKDQAKNLYNYIKEAIQTTPQIAKMVDGEPLASGTKFQDGSEISAVPNSHKAIQGLHKDVVIIDEPALAGDFTINDSRRIVIKDDSLDKIILLGTPFIPPDAQVKSTLYVDMWEDTEKYKEWKRYHWSSMDCPNVSAEQIEEARKSLPDDMFAIFWLGKPYFIGESLIPFEQLKRASLDVKTYFDQTQNSYGGVDWGWRAETVFTIVQIRDGIYHVVASEGWRREDFSDMHDKIAEMAKLYNVDIIFTDSADIGENQRLEDRGLNIVPVVFNKEKTTMQTKMKVLFHQNKIKIDENMMKLKDQLRKYNWDTHERDDRVDSLMLALKGEPDDASAPYFKVL